MSRLQTVSETEVFTQDALKLIGEAGHAALVVRLAANPEAGAVMPGCGGFRKLRWARPGTGKSGGTRVIYYFYDGNHPLLLTAIYAKSKQEQLTSPQKQKLAKLADTIKQQWRLQ